MALTQFAFCSAASDSLDSIYCVGSTVESEAPSGTNAATAAAASAAQGWCRVATDTAVYVSFGAAPNAGTDAIRFFCPAGTVQLFRVSSGDKAAVITI